MDAVLKRAVIAALACVLALPARAGWREDLPAAQPVGEGSMRWFGLTLYHAALFCQDGRYTPAQSCALQLRYARSFKAERIVAASLEQMRKLGAPSARFDDWRVQMQRAFVDVAAGDSLTGVHLPGRGARFYAGERQTAQIDDPEFARWFFAIWLDPASSEPALRRQLIGGAP